MKTKYLSVLPQYCTRGNASPDQGSRGRRWVSRVPSVTDPYSAPISFSFYYDAFWNQNLLSLNNVWPVTNTNQDQ